MSSVVVVGAGVFGAWCALRLAEGGHRVTLLDCYGPASGRASSADHSRVIRAGYGADTIYSRWAIDSLVDWQWLQHASGQTLLTMTGALFMAEPDNAYVRASYDTLHALGRGGEWLEPPEIARRFPALSVDGLGAALFEHDAGVLRARVAVQALVALAVAELDVVYRTARIVPLDESSQSAGLRAQDGSVVDADVFVMASGSWLPRLIPQAVGGRIRPTRQEVLYFGVPAADARFSTPHLPVWIDFGAGLYGIPDIDAHGFKVGIDRHGPLVDPDTLDRLVDPAVVTSTRAWMSTRFPGLQGAPLVDARVCQYENTATGDFIIDRHPSRPDMWIVGGGSGHGFKHGPAVARYLVESIEGRATPEPRFALKGKTELAERAVF
jgi:sarcosine oxidase